MKTNRRSFMIGVGVTAAAGALVPFDKALAAITPKQVDYLDPRVRAIVENLKKAINEAAKNSLFEFNDEFARMHFKNLINPYLEAIKSKRDIYDYLTVCDETINTPERIDKNEFYADVYIKPTRSIKFVVLNVSTVMTGVEFEEVIGTV